MKLSVYHWRTNTLDIPGIFFENDCWFVDVPIEELGSYLVDLAKNFDVMLLAPKNDGEQHRLCIDQKGFLFKIR